MRIMNKKIVLILFFLGIIFPKLILADNEGQIKNFFVDQNYDLKNREQISAFLKIVSNHGYFYLEKDWYKNLTEEQKEKIDKNLQALVQKFDSDIYPKLTSLFGQEWKPGIDNDERITILFHLIKEQNVGYFNSGDEYSKIQNPTSNEREMIYLSAENLFFDNTKDYLAHEFVHLITFNQKDRLRGITEEIWLNEARADYASSLLGYDQMYQNSNLQQRVHTFLQNPSDSLTEWQNQKKDYGVVNLFIQYLVDYYGKQILIDSLKSSQNGIFSIDYALEKNGIKQNFSQIFTDWIITVFLNNCNFGKNYCYKNENLKNIRITPSLIFLPSIQKAKTSLFYSINPWAGHWYRIMGGQGELKINFKGTEKTQFKIFYALCQNSQDCKVDELNLNKEQQGEIIFKDFGERYTSLTLMPSIQSKKSGFNGKESSYDFSISISIENLKQKQETIEELKNRIKELELQISALNAKIAFTLQKRMDCNKFSQNLYFGMKSLQVKCLQFFLKNQKEIYPEGLITGYFGPLTQAAVIRFQKKYYSEILTPLKLKEGTGFVGPATRFKINQIISQQKK